MTFTPSPTKNGLPKRKKATDVTHNHYTLIFTKFACANFFCRYAYESHAACTFNQEYNHAAFQISFMLTSYAIPLAIICLLYFGMLFRLWKSVSAAGSSGRSLRGKKRVTRMVVVVVGVFAVCWLPIQVSKSSLIEIFREGRSGK